MLEDMIQVQKKINDLTFPDWRIKLGEDNWRQAIIAEIGEALESTDYKWWKKTEIDEDNLKVELIDILHFILSYIMIKVKEDDLYFEELENAFIKGFNNQNDIKIILVEMAANIYNIKELVYLLGEAFNTIGLKPEDIYKEYITKATLNIFRQENGYKDGTYIKIWNGKEDNVYAYEFAKDLSIKNLFENLMKKLKEVYDKIKE